MALQILYKRRRRMIQHIVLFVFINGSILVAWADPGRVNLDGSPGILIVPALWTPIFLIYASNYALREREQRQVSTHQEMAGEVNFPTEKPKRGFDKKPYSLKIMLISISNMIS